MSTQPEPTVEALQAKLEARRQDAGLPKDGRPPSPIGGAVSVSDISGEGVNATCRICGKTFRYLQFGVRNLRLAAAIRRECDGCEEAEQERRRQEYEESIRRAQIERLAARSSQILQLLEAAGVNPREHGHCALDNFDAVEAGATAPMACREFVRESADAGQYDQVRGLYLWGGTGTGKSHLSVGVLREMLLMPDVRPEAVLFDRAEELILRIQDTYSSGASTFDVIDKRVDARLWVLDDLGTERASDDVARHLTLIFARRALAPTLVTSNLSPAELEKRRPELYRLLSRLGPEYFRVVEVRGRDRRFG